MLATCVAAAVKGAEIIRAYEGKRGELQWERKAHADFVSVVDRASEGDHEKSVAALSSQSLTIPPPWS